MIRVHWGLRGCSRRHHTRIPKKIGFRGTPHVYQPHKSVDSWIDQISARHGNSDELVSCMLRSRKSGRNGGFGLVGISSSGPEHQDSRAARDQTFGGIWHNTVRFELTHIDFRASIRIARRQLQSHIMSSIPGNGIRGPMLASEAASSSPPSPPSPPLYPFPAALHIPFIFQL